MSLAAWHEAQLKRLFFQEYAALLAYASGALGNVEAAEEAVQQAFRIACDRPDALLKSRSPGGWLMRTLQNVIRNQLRTQQRWAQLLSDQPMGQLRAAQELGITAEACKKRVQRARLALRKKAGGCRKIIVPKCPSRYMDSVKSSFTCRPDRPRRSIRGARRKSGKRPKKGTPAQNDATAFFLCRQHHNRAAADPRRYERSIVMKKKLIAILLVLVLSICMIIPASATDADAEPDVCVSDFTTEELAFFEDLGIDFDKVVSVSYAGATSTAGNPLTRSASTETVDVLQFDMRDGDTARSTVIMFTDESGNPLSAQSIIDYGVQTGSGSQNYMGITVQYRLRSDGVSETYINPRSVTIWTSTSCTNVSISYYARGNRCSFSSGSPVITQYDTEARIANSYATTLANRDYTTTGGYTDGYALPYTDAIQLVVGSSEAHGATATYTTASGVFYSTGFGF